MLMVLRTSLVVLAVAVALVSESAGADPTWTGGGDGTTWSDGANWDTGSAPTGGYANVGNTDVNRTITVSGTKTAPHWTQTNAGAVNTLQLGGEWEMCCYNASPQWDNTSGDPASMVMDLNGHTLKTLDGGVQYLENITPGSYFKLVSEVTHTSRFRNGAISANGEIVSMDGLKDSVGYPNNISIYFWKPGTVGVDEATLDTTNVSESLYGSVFSVKNTTTEKKIYKCETISYGEEGLIEVSGSYAPTEATTGVLSVLQNWDTQFSVQED